MEWSWKFIFIWGSILFSLRITHQTANLARGGVAAQSSFWDTSRSPNMAIDGRSGTHYNYGSCISTLAEENPWWRLDLRFEYDISKIEVTRRTDCCIHLLQGAEIRIGNSLQNNGNNNPRCAVITNTSHVTTTFNCSQMAGRYVNVFLPGVGKILQFCEVKVYSDTYIRGADVARSGVAVQSSLYGPSVQPSVVIDGNPSSHYASRSCMATKWEENPWWRLDLRGPYQISTISIIRRSDCCIYELQGAEIRIGNSLENNGNNNPRCAVVAITNIINMFFNCNKMTGRYVNIFIPGVNKRLQLCEVKVFATARVSGANVATRGRATQAAEPASSTNAGFAIDKKPEEPCTSVTQRNNPWWQLDLLSIYRITAVSIFSDGDCCKKDLNGAEVRIGLRNDTSNQRCAVISTAEGQQRYNYHCGVMEGRFVHVVHPGKMKTLTVCEVLVYGTVLENVALRGISFQSSSRYKARGEASKVIDGYQSRTCSITEDKPGQSVTVDLLVPYKVTLVQLAYTGDCCYSDEVRVDNTSCRVVSSSSAFLVTLDCGGIVGRYVTVIHPDKPPPLCEVEVYSTWVHPGNKFPQRPPPYVDYCPHKACHRDYVLIHNKPKTWFEAQAYCREKYTDLATINTVQGMNRVIDRLENHLLDCWIGLYEDVLTWRWSLADDDEAEFRSWGEGEPDENSTTLHCTGIQHSGEWINLDCDLLNYFLCYDGKDGAPQSKILIKTPMKWNDAQSYCREHHTDLLSVRNQAENQEIQSLVPEGTLAWIGLFRDSWKWSDETYSSFRYQWQGPPNSTEEGPNCAYISDRKWRVKSCDTKSMFLCYYYKKRSVVRISSDFDTSDPVIQQQILSQLEENMKKKGITDFKISWRMSLKQETPQCVQPIEEETESCLTEWPEDEL